MNPEYHQYMKEGVSPGINLKLGQTSNYASSHQNHLEAEGWSGMKNKYIQNMVFKQKCLA